MSGNLRGDLLVACSALFYSLHVVRLGKKEDRRGAFGFAFVESGLLRVRQHPGRSGICFLPAGRKR